MSFLQDYFDSAILGIVYDNTSLSSLSKQLAAIYCLTSDASALPCLRQMTGINGFPKKQDTIFSPCLEVSNVMSLSGALWQVFYNLRREHDRR
jgi:hypothetical protein